MPIWLSYVSLFVLLGVFIGFASYIYKRVATFCNNKNAALKEIEKRCQQEVTEKKACYEGIKMVMYTMMVDVEKRCQNAGFSEDSDRQLFESLFGVYRAMGGNHGSGELYKRFYLIPSYEQCRRANPELIYRELSRKDEWIFDSDIPSNKLTNSCANDRDMRTMPRDEE